MASSRDSSPDDSVPAGVQANGSPLLRADLLTLALIVEADHELAVLFWKHHAPQAQQGLLSGDGWGWDARRQLYRSASGTSLDVGDLKRFSINFAMGAETSELEPLAQHMAAGNLDLSSWQRQSAQVIKHLYLAQGMLAAGGADHLQQEDIHAIEGSVASKTGTKFAMDRMANFGEVVDGQEQGGTSVAQVVNRSGFYADTSNTVYEDVKLLSHMRAMDEGGQPLFDQERNVLGDSEGSCTDTEDAEGCPEITDEGWQPIDTLPRIGDRSCLMMCKCHFEYGKKDD